MVVVLKQSCTVGLDYLGIQQAELHVDWSDEHKCSYYLQCEADEYHPTERLRVCGNCTFYIVLEVTE